MSQPYLGPSSESLSKFIISPEELYGKINNITAFQRRYIKSIFIEMAKANPANATILAEYLEAQQNELNIKESTKESTIKRIVWLSVFLCHKTFSEIRKEDIMRYLNVRIRKPDSVDA